MRRLNAPMLIALKRDGRALEPDAIRWLVEGFVSGEVADYQMAAFAMAVVLRGMTASETTALTLAMRDSGRCADLSAVKGPKVDKHSTGGVGDKVSICLAPLVAACGVNVPMISGRGLRHTGGTLDKLEAIEGFSVDLPLRRFERLVARLGVAMIGQTDDLAPADRRLYALRDVTATVRSIPLITASILSKKLAEDLDALVMDVKVGRGAFMKTRSEARALARSLVGVGRAADLPVRVVLTRMDSPLGLAVGNALETAEALRLLKGVAPVDLRVCTYALGAEMLCAAGAARTLKAAERRLDEALQSGAAAAKMRAMIRAQGGDPRVVDEPERLPQAPHRVQVRAPRSGYVRDLDALEVGRLSLRLGAGRTRADLKVDPGVGIALLAKRGDVVEKGKPLAVLHLADKAQANQARRALLEAYSIGDARPRKQALVIETIRR